MTEFMKAFWQVIQILGGIAVVVLALAGAAGWFAKKLFENQFSKDLETHKADLQKVNSSELERLRHKLSRELDRRSKLLAREFEVLPTAWDLLHEAGGATNLATLVLREYLDVSRMPLQSFSEVLERTELGEHAKQELLQLEGQERQNQYQKFVDQTNILNGIIKVAAIKNYLLGQSIFIDKSVFQALWDLVIIMDEAVREQQQEMLFPDFREGRFAKTERFRAEWTVKLQELEALVRERLEKSKIDD